MSDYSIYKRDQVQEEKFDVVDRPKHYNSFKYEVIEVIKDQMSPIEFEGYLVGNIKKYMARYKLKNGKEDIKKAQFYLNRLVKEYDEGYLS